MGEILNQQPTKHLQQFQKLIVQNLYIKQLNLWLDNLNWENEKKEAIIEMKDQEIAELKHKISTMYLQQSKLDREFKDYINKVKQSKVDTKKADAQQALINELKNKLSSAESRLKTQHRLNELLVRQNKKK